MPITAHSPTRRHQRIVLNVFAFHAPFITSRIDAISGYATETGTWPKGPMAASPKFVLCSTQKSTNTHFNNYHLHYDIHSNVSRCPKFCSLSPKIPLRPRLPQTNVDGYGYVPTLKETTSTENEPLHTIIQPWRCDS